MPDAVNISDPRIVPIPTSKYSWQIFVNSHMFADLTGIATNRKFSITRGDSDEISFSVSIDRLIDLANTLNINPQDIIQSAYSEVRVGRYGTVLSAGELMPWSAKVGSDRMINLTARGWFELLKYRRTSDFYTNKSQLYIAQDLLTVSLAKTFGNSGNYNGLQIGTVPSSDMTNTYVLQQYDDKTLYDAIKEMSEEANGIDFEVTWDKKLNIYWPNIGVARPDVVFTYPGNVKDISYSVDPTKQVNAMLARGKGDGYSQVSLSVSDSASQQKYGLREDTRDYNNIGSIDQLTQLANTDLALYKEPLIIHQIIFDGSGRTSAPQVGTFHIGDKIQLFVQNFELYSDVNRYFKIDKIEVEISDEDEETVTLSVS